MSSLASPAQSLKFLVRRWANTWVRPYIIAIVHCLLHGIHKPRDKALFALIYLYGLRISEVALLKLEDVDFERDRIYITRVKGGIGGEKPLFQNVKKLLLSYLNFRPPTGDRLFTGRQGNLKVSRIHQLFKLYLEQAGLNGLNGYTVHSLRHSIATHLLNAGQGIEFVQDHLGHANIQNTMIYARLTDRRREKIFNQIEKSSEILKL